MRRTIPAGSEGAAVFLRALALRFGTGFVQESRKVIRFLQGLQGPSHASGRVAAGCVGTYTG